MNSGDSEARGAIHWTRMNSSTPYARPVASRLSANGSAARQMVRPAMRNRVMVAARRGIFGSSPMSSEGPPNSGSAIPARDAETT